MINSGGVIPSEICEDSFSWEEPVYIQLQTGSAANVEGMEIVALIDQSNPLQVLDKAAIVNHASVMTRKRGRCSTILESLTTLFAWFPLFDVMTNYAVLVTFFYFSTEEKSHLEIVIGLIAIAMLHNSARMITYWSSDMELFQDFMASIFSRWDGPYLLYLDLTVYNFFQIEWNFCEFLLSFIPLVPFLKKYYHIAVSYDPFGSCSDFTIFAFLLPFIIVVVYFFIPLIHISFVAYLGWNKSKCSSKHLDFEDYKNYQTMAILRVLEAFPQCILQTFLLLSSNEKISSSQCILFIISIAISSLSLLKAFIYIAGCASSSAESTSLKKYHKPSLPLITSESSYDLPMETLHPDKILHPDGIRYDWKNEQVKAALFDENFFQEIEHISNMMHIEEDKPIVNIRNLRMQTLHDTLEEFLSFSFRTCEIIVQYVIGLEYLKTIVYDLKIWEWEEWRRDGIISGPFKSISLHEDRRPYNEIPIYVNIQEDHSDLSQGRHSQISRPSSQSNANYYPLGRTSTLTFGEPFEYTIGPHDSKRMIDKQFLEIGEIIGKGSFNTIRRGNYRKKHHTIQSNGVRLDWFEDITVALKSMDLNQAYKQYNVMERAWNQENLCFIHGICKVDDTCWMVQEYFESCSLLDSCRRGKFTLQFLYHAMRSITAGLRYLHKLHIVHGDVALRNVLWSKEKQADGVLARIALADYDFSFYHNKYFPAQKKMKCIPLRWAAPELFITQNATFETDVWALGITFVEMLSMGRKPYCDLSMQEVAENLRQYEHAFHPVLDTTWPEEMQQLLSHIFVHQDQRDGLDEISKRLLEFSDALESPPMTQQENEL